MITKIKPEYLDHYREDKPLQSVWLEFIRKNTAEVLDLGEFEALRRWLLGCPQALPVKVNPGESHRVARDFFKSLRKEQKISQ